MGKSLIIKGADFSRNAVDSTWIEATIVQGYVTTNNTSSTFGKIILDASLTTVKRSIFTKILIPANKSISIVVENSGDKMTGLNLGYVASQTNVDIINNAVVPNIAAYRHPADSSLRESDGSFLVENSSVNDMYFYLNVCYNITAGPDFLISGKRILFKNLEV